MDMAYFVEYSISDVVTHLLEKRGLSNTSANRSAVENELRTAGTISTRRWIRTCRNTVQTPLSQWDSYPALADTPSRFLVGDARRTGP
jgi:hypothetical protein